MILHNKYRILLIVTCVAAVIALTQFNIEQSNFVFIIEEIIGITLFALGFLVFQPIIALISQKRIKRTSNPQNRKRHFISLIGLTLLFSLLLSFILFGTVWLYDFQFGTPEFHQIKEQLLEIKRNDFGTKPHIPAWYYIHEFSAFAYIPQFIAGSTLLFLFLFGIEEYLVYYKSLQDKKLKKEQEAKEFALSKIYAIQAQLNPHFMFNTLNVLSGLMHEDLNKADIFIKKLSEIYRYVILQSEEIVSSLEKEIEFSRAYIYLLKIRFEDKMSVNINIEESKLAWMVPSLTLELLIENAIKHNSFDYDNPLEINIYTENENLIVKNNYLPRINRYHSTGIGIRNLEKRLHSLGIETASFNTTKGYFTATIPLIKSI